MMVSGVGFDLFGDPLNSSADFQNSKSYFSDDGNAPPYHIGFRYLYHCSPTAQQGCQQNAQLFASGFAEYLDGSNWDLPQNGIQPGAVYGAMAIHQQVYATIAKKLAAMSYPANADGTGSVLDPNSSQCLQTVNSWDIAIPPGYTIGTTQIGAYPLNPTSDSPGCS